MLTYTNNTNAFEVYEADGTVRAKDLETGSMWEFTPEKFGAFAQAEGLTVYDPTAAYDAMAELFESMGFHDLAAQVDQIAATYVDSGVAKKTRTRDERAEEVIVRVQEDMEVAPDDDLVDDLEDAVNDLKDSEPPVTAPIDPVYVKRVKRGNEVTK